MKSARLSCAITPEDHERVEKVIQIMQVSKSKFLLGVVRYALDQIEEELDEGVGRGDARME